ncbi:hypothetical protein ACE3MQ_19410 [Paenibacillus lentus]|uniref:hypothetical protein n=1 Tax=Paenibacillus lentus TaxID=1338368 RepID=UPI0036555FAF
MSKIISVILCLFIITACDTMSQSQMPQELSSFSQEILNKAGVFPNFIDASKYSGDESEIVRTLNTAMKYSLDNNLDGYKSLLSLEHPGKYENTENKKVLSIIVSLGSPKFNFLSDFSAEVFIDQSQITVDDPEATVSSTTKLYNMVKENNEWKILSVQN